MAERTGVVVVIEKGRNRRMKFIHCDVTAFKEAKRGKRILCFGASGTLYDAVEELEIENEVAAVTDNAPDKQGNAVRLGERTLYIEKLSDILGSEQWKPQDGIVLITSRFYEEIIAQLERVPELNDTECYAYPCLQLYIEKGTDAFFYKRLIEPCLYTYDEILGYQGVCGEKRKELVREKEKDLLSSMDGYHRLVIPRVVLAHGNKCNLNCEHCGAFMPDVEEPFHIPSEQLLKDVELFLRGVEECLMVDITDGEPLLNPELDVLINGLTANEKIKCVFFYSNGTYIPKESVLQALEHPKVVVVFSDYGFLEKMSKIITLFEKRGINFRVLTDMYWVNTDSMEHRGRSEDFLKYHFLNCEAGKTRKRMAYGKLWTCTRSFRFHSLNLYESPNDYVELKDTDTDEELRRKILKLYLADTADACNYCDYGNMAAERVKAGIQKNKNIKKSDYTIISRDELHRLMGLSH